MNVRSSRIGCKNLWIFLLRNVELSWFIEGRMHKKLEVICQVLINVLQKRKKNSSRFLQAVAKMKWHQKMSVKPCFFSDFAPAWSKKKNISNLFYPCSKWIARFMYQKTTKKALAESKYIVRTGVLSPSPNYYGVQCHMR